MGCLVWGAACNPAPSPHWTADLAIEGATILTMDPSRALYAPGTLLIKDGAILALGPQDSLAGQYVATRRLQAEGQLVLPGLINTHCHAAMVLFRGLADDLALQDWLQFYIWPAEAEFIDSLSVRVGTQLAMAEMIRGGITTFNDMYFYMDEVARAAKAAGMRAVIAEGLLDFPVPGSPNPEQGLARTRRLLEGYQNDPLITVAVGPHAPYSCSSGLLQQADSLARRWEAPLHIHLSETRTELADIARPYGGLSPPAYLDSLGLLGPRTIGAHGVWLSPADIELLAARQVGISHNPESNMKLASGVAPLVALRQAGVKLGLGTDGAASNNNLDLWQEMNTAAKLQKVHLEDPAAMEAYAILLMATRGGAQLLGLDQQVGSLEVGKRADLQIVDLQGPHAHPIYNLYSQVVYALRAGDVRTVIIDGRLVMEDRQLLTLDEASIFRQVDSLAGHIREKLLAP
ncbi:MAG: amidohydrolase [Bacteroidetes bacterium]|nr:MAG: amidohydrolase [Bacteroidota bacterium]